MMTKKDKGGYFMNRTKIGIVFLLAWMCTFFSFVPASALEQNERVNVFNDTWKLQTKTYKTIVVDPSKEKNPSWAIQLALNEAKTSKQPIKVFVKKGNYSLTKPLRIYSNTWLQLEKGTVMIRNHDQVMLLNGDYGASYSGYNGNSNIIIDGGTWDGNGDSIKDDGTAFGISHAQNVLIQNVTVKDIYYSHGIDLAGSKNVVIRHSSFIGFFDDGTRGYAEAIQVDITASIHSFHEFGSYDLTPSQNIRIEDNYFGNSTTKGAKPWGVGIGSHSAVNGKKYDNIQILHNTFDHLSSVAIKAINWENVMIYQNNISASTYALFATNTEKDSVFQFSILENKIDLQSSNKVALRFLGHPTAKISDIYIRGNAFSHVSPGQKRAFWSDTNHIVFDEDTNTTNKK